MCISGAREGASTPIGGRVWTGVRLGNGFVEVWGKWWIASFSRTIARCEHRTDGSLAVHRCDWHGGAEGGTLQPRKAIRW
jgi:hypothetical protein